MHDSGFEDSGFEELQFKSLADLDDYSCIQDLNTTYISNGLVREAYVYLSQRCPGVSVSLIYAIFLLSVSKVRTFEFYTNCCPKQQLLTTNIQITCFSEYLH